MMNNNYSVLYAEDEEKTRKNFVACFEMFFGKVYEAKNGKEALTLYEEKSPDILILDIQMPEISGLEVTKIIRKTDLDVKIIILTAHSDKERLLSAVPLRLNDYLIKPISRTSFISTIEKTITGIAKERDNDDLILLNKELDLKFNFTTGILYKLNETVPLTKYERCLLILLINKRNSIVTKNDVFNSVWDDLKLEYKDENIRNLVKKLRKKLPDDMIKSVYGSGYIFKLPNL